LLRVSLHQLAGYLALGDYLLMPVAVCDAACEHVTRTHVTDSAEAWTSAMADEPQLQERVEA
jgi:hypothetical protein